MSGAADDPLAQPAAPPSKRRWRRALLLLLAGLSIGLAGLWIGRHKLLGPRLEAWVAARARVLGAEFSVGAWGGDWHSTLSLRDVAWRQPNGVLAELTCAAVSADVEPWRVLRGGTDVVSALQLEGLRVRLDLSKPSDRSDDRSATDDRSGAAALDFLALLPRAQIGADEIVVEIDPRTRLRLEAARFLLEDQSDGERGLSLQAERATFEDERGTHSGRLSGRLRLRGGLLDVRELRLEAPRPSDAIEIERGALDLAAAFSGALRLSLAGRALGGRFDVALDSTREQLGLRGSVEQLDLPALWTWIDPQAIAPGGRIEGRFDLLRLPQAQGRAWSGPFEASWLDPCIGSVALASLAARGELAEERVIFHTLAVEQGSNRAVGRHLALPFSGFDWTEVLFAAGVEIELELGGLAQLVPLNWHAGGMSVRALPWDGARLGAHLTPRGIAFDAGSLRTRGGSIEIAAGSVAWSADGPRDWRHATFDLDLAADFEDVRELGRLFGAEDWRGAWAGKLRASGSFERPHGSVDLTSPSFEVAGYAFDDVLLRATLEPDRIALENARAVTPWGAIEASGEIDWRARSWRDMSVWFSSDAATALGSHWLERGSIACAAVLNGPLLDPIGLGELHAEALVLGSAAGRWSGREVESVRGWIERRDGVLVVEPFVATAQQGELELALTLAPLGATLDEWSWPVAFELQRAVMRQAESSLSLAAPARGLLAPEHVRVEDLRLTAPAGELSASLDWTPQLARAQVRAQEFDPRALLAWSAWSDLPLEVLSATVDATLETGTLAATLDLAHAQVGASGGEETWTASGKLQLQGGELAVEALQLDGAGGSRATASARLALVRSEAGWPIGVDPSAAMIARAELAIDAWNELPAVWRAALPIASGALSARLRLAGPLERPLGELELELQGLTAAEEAGPSGLGSASGSARVSFEPEPRLRQARLRFDAGGIEAHGWLDAPDWLARLAGGEAASLLDRALELDARLRLSDLSALLFERIELRRLEGDIEAALAWRGSLGASVPSGWIECRQGSLRLLGELPSLDAIDARVALENGALNIERLRCELGAAPLEVQGTWRPFDATPSGRLHLRGSDVLLTRSNDLRLRADVDLELEVDATAKFLRGELVLTDALYARRHEILRGPVSSSGTRAWQLFSFESAALSDLQFDVKIKSEKQALEIDSNIAKGSARPDLVLSGTGRSPQLTGALFFDPTRVLLPATSLTLTSGTVTLDRREPLEPRLDLQLEGRLRGFDVRARVGGKLSAPTTELSSVPPLSHEDLVMLILSGQTPQEREGGLDRNEAARSLATFFGRDLLSAFGGSSEGDSLAERIEWQTGTDLTRSGAATSEVSVRLSRDVREAGRALILRAERDIYDRINLGLRLLFRID